MNHFQDFTPRMVYGVLSNGFISVALAKALPKEISGEVVNFIFKFPGYSALSRESQEL